MDWIGTRTNSTSCQTAPQLWKLEIVRDRDRAEYAQTSRLNLKHTFALKGPVDIAGPCHFGGKDDQFVLCAGKGHYPFHVSASWLWLLIVIHLSGRYTHLGPRDSSSPALHTTSKHFQRRRPDVHWLELRNRRPHDACDGKSRRHGAYLLDGAVGRTVGRRRVFGERY